MTVLDWILGGFFGLVAACALTLTVQLFVKIRQANLVPKAWKSGKEWLENSALAGLPSTNFKVVTTTALYFFTFLAWAAAVLFEKPVDEFTFGLWLAFLAGLGGFTVAQFKAQRSTDYGALDRQAEIERAKAGGPKAGVTVNTKEATVTGPSATVEEKPNGGQAG